MKEPGVAVLASTTASALVSDLWVLKSHHFYSTGFQKKCVLFSHSLGEESAVRVNRIFLLCCTCPVLHHWERMLVFCMVVLNTACGNRYINTERDTLTSQTQPLTFSEVVLLR